MKKWLDSEFFKSNQGRKSSGRLLPFLAFPFATIVLLWCHTESAMSIYLGAYVLHYGLSKGGDIVEKFKKEAE